MRTMSLALRHELVGLSGVIERNIYLVKRYIWWDVAFFLWTVANTLTIVFIAKGIPAVGGTIGKLNLPRGVSELLGGADYATLTGWFQSEIGAVYGPLVIGAVAITAAAATTAGEEEDRILALVLAHPITRARLVLAKAAAVAALVVVVAVAAWVGLLIGVALGGGGISVGHMAALAVHLGCFGLAMGAVALAVGAGTGRRAMAGDSGGSPRTIFCSSSTSSSKRSSFSR